MHPLTVQQLIDSLQQMIEAGKIEPDYVFGFSHDQRESTADQRVYPLDSQRFAIVDCYQGAPKMVVFYGKARDE
jgi:hypothetical protein